MPKRKKSTEEKVVTTIAVLVMVYILAVIGIIGVGIYLLINNFA